MALKIKAAVRTDAGRVRKNNEDSFYLDGTYLALGEMDHGGAFALQTTADCAVFAVCDGMGGEEKGEEASHLAACAMDSLRDTLGMGNAADVWGEIDKACGSANDSVCALSDGRAGTTVAALCFYNNKAYCANLGDSRIYVYRAGKLIRVNTDHTEAARLVKMGTLSEREAARSMFSHVLTYYIGMPHDQQNPFEAAHYPDFVLHYGDRFLLCSDGLTDMLDDAEIGGLLARGESAGKTVNLLVEAALEKGGKDNVTALVVDAAFEDGNFVQPRFEQTVSEEPVSVGDPPQSFEQADEIEIAELAEPTEPKPLFDDDSTTMDLENETDF